MIEEHVTEADRARAELDELLSVVSHDLREPLRAIIGFGTLLEAEAADDLSDRGREFLGLILDGGRRMELLLDGLSRFGRAGRRTQEMSDVDLDAVVDTALGRLRAQIEARQARVTHDPLPVVAGDPAGMQEMLEQLIANAVKFNESPQPHVHVGATPGALGVELTVADDGIGIPGREHDRVFELFRRLHPRDEYPGLGVGLAVCRRIVERHGGRIWIQDGPDGGSVVHVLLPDAEAARA